jgi:hypothetical protein
MRGTLWRNSTQEEGCTGHSFIHSWGAVPQAGDPNLCRHAVLCSAVLCAAQAAMSSNEAQVRADAAATCERLAAEYESRIALIAAELDRTRQELAVRTHALGSELTR